MTTGDTATMEPNVELLRIDGWQVIAVSGPYCTVWRNGVEAIYVWRDGRWQRLPG